MKTKCRVCGDTFTVSKETEELVEDGEIMIPEICDECLEDMNHDLSIEPEYFDCDPGL